MTINKINCDGVDIALTNVTNDLVEAEVVGVNKFWSERGFKTGMLLAFKQTGINGEWTIQSSKDLPWFILFHLAVAVAHFTFGHR
jgi:hypothetical protein